MMNYLEATNGLKRIQEFRDLYLQFLKASRTERSQGAWQLQQSMALSAPYVQRDLDKVGLAHFILQEAPILGGAETPAEVTSLAYHPRICAQYNLRADELTLYFERAIGEYIRLRSRAFWNLFNPFWWMREILAFIISLPFYIVGLAGFNQRAIESSFGGRLFKLAGGLIIIGAALATIVQFLVNLGWLSF